MEAWLAVPQLMPPMRSPSTPNDRINLDDLTEPVLAAPTIRQKTSKAWLSEVAGQRSMRCSSGSCMTNIRHYRRRPPRVLQGAAASPRAQALGRPPRRMGLRDAAGGRGYTAIFRGRRRPQWNLPGLFALHWATRARSNEQHQRGFSNQHPATSNNPPRQRRPGVPGQAPNWPPSARWGHIPTPAEYLEDRRPPKIRSAGGRISTATSSFDSDFEGSVTEGRVC